MSERELPAWEAGPKFGGLITDTGLKERQNPSYICPSCGNMLWNFKNDGSKLTRVCRNCNHTDDMESNLVYVNDVKFAGGTDHVASADMVKDPTLPRATNVDCNSCHFNEAVFFQKPMRGDEGMKLIFMCIRCARAAHLLAPPCVLATLRLTAAPTQCAGARTNGSSERARRRRCRSTQLCGPPPPSCTLHALDAPAAAHEHLVARRLAIRMCGPRGAGGRARQQFNVSRRRFSKRTTISTPVRSLTPR